MRRGPEVPIAVWKCVLAWFPMIPIANGPLQDDDLLIGRLWPPMLVAVAAAPCLLYRLVR